MSKHLRADGEIPKTPGFEAVFMEVSALRSSGSIIGISNSEVEVVVIGL